ncbi:hypothetical protein M3Y94_00235800 [Aphelenchoides besseyi]|nr:hypothetical protein M3Y94_00235800 [Aphelenchoides besseyi]KAI6236395.1 FMRFamide receptor [Aphelenchoides besseyi]
MSSLINGPITLSIVIFGTIFNAIVVYVLATKKIQRFRQSVYNSPQNRKFSNTIHNDRCSVDALNNVLASTRKRPTRGASTRPRVYTFFVWLIVSDTTLLLCALFLYCVPNLLRNLGSYAHLFPYLYFLSNTALTTSVWLISALMLDRYRSLVVNTFSVRSSTPAVNRVLLCVCAAAFVYNIPRFFELGSEIHEPTQRPVIYQTELVQSSVYMLGYRIVGGILFYSLVPYGFLFVLGFKVWMVIRRAAQQRQKMNANSASNSFLHANTTDSEMILIAVIAKFLLSRLLPTILDCVEHIVGAKEFTHSATLTICVDMSNLVVVTSSAINLFIFYACSASFRKSLRGLFDKKTRLRTRSPLSHVSIVSMTPIMPNSKKTSSRMPPRQLSLQVNNSQVQHQQQDEDQRVDPLLRPTPINRKVTVSGISLDARRDESISPLPTIEKIEGMTVEPADVQKLAVTPNHDAISLP